MKRSMFGFMFAALLTLSLSVVARASTTDELIISSGTNTCYVVDNTATTSGSCGSLVADSNLTAGTDTTSTGSGTFNNWTITVTTGISKSPSLSPYGLDLVSLTASCAAATCATLDIQYTDINFDIPGTFTAALTANNSGGGSTTESAYVSSSNTLGAETTLIGSQTFSADGSASGTVSGGTTASTSYSLTLDESFTGNSGANFNDTGKITLAPEGWSLSSALGMLGFGVVALVVARRRGLVKTTV